MEDKQVVYHVNLTVDQLENIKGLLLERFDELQEKVITGVLIKKLPASDLIQKNKPVDSKGKTSHIAFTTKSRYFFDEIFGINILDSNNKFDDEVMVPINVNIEAKYDEYSTKQEGFIESYTYIWRIVKGNRNQLGMSYERKNDEAFNNFRNEMYLNDYLVFIKTEEDEQTEDYNRKLYCVLIKEEENDEAYQILNEIYSGQKIRFFEEEKQDGSIEIASADPSVNGNFNGRNVIFYGVPGSGKSHGITKKYSEPIYRTTFFEDYSYADFVGQIAPVLKEQKECYDSKGIDSDQRKMVYDFIPGDFAKVLKKSIKNPYHMNNFVIEELNRANTAAVFGDVFQLLDREDGISKYKINNENLSKYIYDDLDDRQFVEDWLGIDIEKNEIKIPNNLNILATMNTSDQNISPLDTAFTRRWDLEYIEIDFSKLDKDLKIDGLNIYWSDFAKYVNNKILSLGLMNSEDKQLGPFFAKEHEILNARIFANKVLVYLWKDVFKRNYRDELFNTELIHGIQDLIQNFSQKDPYSVFNEEVVEYFRDKQGEH